MEGFDCGGGGEFRRFLCISRGSAGEVNARLYVAVYAGLIDKVQFNSLYNMATEAGNLIGGFIRYPDKK